MIARLLITVDQDVVSVQMVVRGAAFGLSKGHGIRGLELLDNGAPAVGFMGNATEDPNSGESLQQNNDAEAVASAVSSVQSVSQSSSRMN